MSACWEVTLPGHQMLKRVPGKAFNMYPTFKSQTTCRHTDHWFLDQIIFSSVFASSFATHVLAVQQAEIARILDVAMNPNSLFVSFSDGKRARNANVSGSLGFC